MILVDMETVSKEQKKGSFRSAPPECAPVRAIPETWDGGRETPAKVTEPDVQLSAFSKDFNMVYGC